MGHCVGLLDRHPEETSTVLRYLGELDAFPEVEGEIAQFLQSPDAVYPYQSYLILEWLCEEAENPSEGLIDIVRRLAFDPSLPAYVRLLGWRFLGLFGAVADLERIEARYAEARGTLEQSEIICCLVRVERGRRNAFLARAAGDGEPNRRAVAWVRRQ